MPARWRLALTVTRAVGLVSLGISIASFAGMAVGFLSCGCGDEEWELPVSCATENCPARVPCCIHSFSCLLDLRGGGQPRLGSAENMLVALQSQEAEGSSKSEIFGLHHHIGTPSPSACVFLVLVVILLESRSAKGSLMETAGKVILYLGLGMTALITAVLAIVAFCGSVRGGGYLRYGTLGMLQHSSEMHLNTNVLWFGVIAFHILCITLIYLNSSLFH